MTCAIHSFTIRCAAALLVMLVGLTACSQRNIAPAPESWYAPTVDPDVRLHPGDVVEVRFFYTPELNITQTVRVDGVISLEMIGDVSVLDETTDQLSQDIARAYEPHLKDPKVAVILRSQANQRVFVSGAVQTPGIVAMPHNMTALNAIMESGGFNLVEADLKHVLIIRHLDAARKAYKIDMSPIFSGEPTTPFYLQPGDVVYVSRTPIVDVDQWVDQHINQLIPDVMNSRLR